MPMPEPLWHATTAPDVVKIPERTVLVCDGEGGPEQPAFEQAIGALYGVAYTLKFERKRRGKDFRIGPLEARWWAEPDYSIAIAPRDTWRWQLRLAMPSTLRDRDVAMTVVHLLEKNRGKLKDNRQVGNVRLEHLASQRLGRALHIGPYVAEGKTLAEIDTQMARAHLAPARSHIEVYLNDPRRTKPDRLKTVLLRELA